MVILYLPFASCPLTVSYNNDKGRHRFKVNVADVCDDITDLYGVCSFTVAIFIYLTRVMI